MNQLAENRSAEPTLRERLIALIQQVLAQPTARPFPIDARLSDLGVSSLKMVKLMLALEMQFDVTIPQSEITPDNFASIASVEALLIKLADSAPPH